MTTIVLLNGPGSVGKSSIAAALQSIADEPFLHVQMDTFLEMLPPACQEGPAGFRYDAAETAGGREVVVTPGPVGERTLRGMRHAIAALAGQGNNLIVDDVLCHGEMPDYVRLLSAFTLHLVGLTAPLDVLEARERERGDRLIGLARWQHRRVHAGVSYDLEIDTSRATALESARLIKQRFGL